MDLNFIQENKTQNNEEHIEMICKAILLHMGDNIYDGTNRYAPRVCVCYNKEKDDYYWGKWNDHNKVFEPTTSEIESAMQEFKKRGYFPCYDNNVCFYRVHKDKSEVRGEYAIRHTIWL